MSAILSLKWLPKKPAGKPETAVFFSEKPETAGFPKSQDCPQPTPYPSSPHLAAAGGLFLSPSLFIHAKSDFLPPLQSDILICH